MDRQHHQLNGHEFEQTLGDTEGQGSLMSCSLQGRKESDATERLNNCKATSSGLVSYGHENTDWRKTIFDSLTLLKIFSHEKEKKKRKII